MHRDKPLECGERALGLGFLRIWLGDRRVVLTSEKQGTRHTRVRQQCSSEELLKFWNVLGLPQSSHLAPGSAGRNHFYFSFSSLLHSLPPSLSSWLSFSFEALEIEPIYSLESWASFLPPNHTAIGSFCSVLCALCSLSLSRPPHSVVPHTQSHAHTYSHTTHMLTSTHTPLPSHSLKSFLSLVGPG